jgi:hypothetical protein
MKNKHSVHLSFLMLNLLAVPFASFGALSVVPVSVVPATAHRLSLPARGSRPPVFMATNWSDINDCTYDMRAQFFTGLKGLEAKVNSQVGELVAKNTTRQMTDRTTADNTDVDLAMKELRAAQSYLKAMDDEARQATPETWYAEKDKVASAWDRAQQAYKEAGLYLAV